ncbi:purine and uridine phosphorylase [Aspergillus sclerotiicarbonarius CBS 121057]|uniref:Purine and uridine phosphorylase n=1 Tax=Aspergillus sclerotiicarbonarius (strain CBS 121057 / IBT 28362) TaxID=1448318 RepID=A0A319DUA1_ASPSB|nr:purine and uridine phosphorylase [Aspergillus sclerotiicarbonarius CBS 121057]
MSDPLEYTVGWICCKVTDLAAALSLLDEEHERVRYTKEGDSNDYTLGRMSGHNVVLAILPDGCSKITAAVCSARDMLRTFPNVRVGFLVGVAGGVPSPRHDIRLGDIAVNIAPVPERHAGVLSYGSGEMIQGQRFRAKESAYWPPPNLVEATERLRERYQNEGHHLEETVNAALEKYFLMQEEFQRPNSDTDRLYQSRVVHPADSDSDCATSCGNDGWSLIMRDAREDDKARVHYGIIASGNCWVKDAMFRDALAAEKNVLCFEMEGADLCDDFRGLNIRGISNYADTHQTKQWRGYAAMMAAAYTKDLLSELNTESMPRQYP